MADISDTITVEELIRILDRRPDLLEALRQRILTRELLELPEKFAAFATETRERFDRMDERFDRMEGRADRTDERFDRMEGRADRTDGRLDRVDGRLDRVEGKLGRVEGRLDRVEGRLGNLEGWRYEAKLARMLAFFCVANLDMTEPVVLMSEGMDSAPELNSLVQTLRNEGRLNAQDFAEIVECDAIARDNENRYALFEASMTVDESDVERAIRRSKLLAEIVDAPTTPVVIGAAISDDIRESAAARGVPFIHMSSRV